MTKPALVYWDLGKSTFVRKDIQILSRQFQVNDFTFKAFPRYLLPFRLLGQFFSCLFTIPRCSAVVCQFASYHSWLPFVIAGWFGKKRILVAGGTDCVSFPSIGYGNFQKKYLRSFTAWSFRKADLILPVHETLIDYNYTYTDSDLPRQGYRNFVTGITAREKVIWNGYDSDFWHPQDVIRKKKTVITVGSNFHTGFAFRLKGIDLYLQLAAELPEFEFAIVGGQGLSKSELPSNVVLLPNIPNDQLPQLFSRYTYYAQLSMSEGFPNALCEAILCGCIPIVTAVGAMPMIVQDSRNVLVRKNSELLVALVRNLESATDLPDYRNLIASRYSYANRERDLVSAVKEIIAG